MKKNNKIYNCSFNPVAGYVLDNADDIKVIDKETLEEIVLANVSKDQILEDASKAYIKHDIYTPTDHKVEAVGYKIPNETPDVVVEKHDEEECSCNGYCGDHDCVCESESCECCKEEEKDPVGVEEFNKQIDAYDAKTNVTDFGDYLIVIGDYSERDFNIYTGPKRGLNTYINTLHLHETPKVYKLTQLKVETKYEVK